MIWVHHWGACLFYILILDVQFCNKNAVKGFVRFYGITSKVLETKQGFKYSSLFKQVSMGYL